MSNEVTNELDHLHILRWNKNERKMYIFNKRSKYAPKLSDIQRILSRCSVAALYLQLCFFSPSLNFAISFQAEVVIVFHNSRGLSYNRDMQLHEKNIKQMRLQIFSTQILRYFVQRFVTTGCTTCILSWLSFTSVNTTRKLYELSMKGYMQQSVEYRQK